MWTTKTWEFKTLRGRAGARARMQAWIDRNDHRTQWEQIFVNNAYGVIYRALVKPGLPR